MMENRCRAKSLGGRELTLQEAKAVRTVLVKMGRISDAELASLESSICRMESSKLLADLEYLRVRNCSTLVRMEQQPNRQLGHDDEVHLLAWLDRIAELQRSHPHHLHVGHLLNIRGGSDEVLRDLNIGYQHLGVLSKAEEYTSRGLIDHVSGRPTPWLEQLLAAMEAKPPLLDYLTKERETSKVPELLGLPEAPVQQARLMHLYADYIEFKLIENAYREHGALELAALGRGRKLLGYQELQNEADPEGHLRGILEELGVRLLLHLPKARR